MEQKIAYAIRLTPNIFCATFINCDSLKEATCYMLDDKKSNMGALPTIIDSCLLIGYNNKIYDDIILSFYYHHRESNIKELWSFSEIITHQPSDIWRDPRIEYYMNKHVESIDLYNVINIDKGGYLEADLDTLINKCMKDTQDILEGLNRFKKDQNDGYKRKRERITSESAYINYILRKIL
jgi:hypothetical protein